MKSRSHRLPVTEPRHDDWVDGSWTVECTCGVNYDDGEEMVDCDECGVWVHTRCSRYVKSEKSFACDKCKNKKTGGGGSGGGSVRNESEETEVAEFLLELPTKTLRMDKPNPATVSSRRPFRLWAAIPMEERVHVQGVPGGEPDLFSGIGMSSVFGPQLWKCAGYVPKKFNYRSTEFPCLGNGEVEEKFPCVGKSEVEEKGEGKMDKTGGDENGNRSDNGAGVLLSLLKKNDDTLPTPVVDSVGAKRLVEGSPCHEVVTPREKKKMGAENRHSASPKESTKKEKSSMRVVLHCGKRRKEEPGVPKDQHAKKKLRIIEKEGDVKKRAVHSSKGVASTSSSDGKHLEFSQGRGSKATINEIPCDKDFVRDRVLDGLGKCATNLASNEHGPEATLRNDVPSDEISRGRSGGDQVPVISANVSETSNDVDLLRGVGGSPSVPAKEEVAEGALQRCTGDTGSVKIGSCEKKPVVVGVRLAGEDAKENENSQGSDTDEANSRPNKKLKGELDSDNHADHHIESLHLNDVKSDSTKSNTQYPELTVDVASEECKVVEISTISSEACEPKMLDASTKLTVGSSRTDESDELGGNASQSRRISPGSEGSRGARKSFSGLERSSEVAGELLKYNGTARSNSTASYQRKAVKSVLKSPPSSCAIISKSSENCQAATAQGPRVHSRHELSDGCPVTVKDNPLSGKVEHEENCGRSKKLVKEPLRSSSLSRVSESTRLSNASDSKRPSTDTKDSSIRSSYKATLVENMAATRVSDENANPPVMEGASNIQNKAASSAVPGKGEKFYQSGGQPSSRGHVASATAPSSSNIPATLSDEELALLLHQELNSSPRVPRVPRMRHAGSLPQIAGPSATSMLMKRTCSGGVKDQGAAPRRRNKDISGEGSHASLEVDNETKKVERKPYSPDTRRQDSGYSVDLLSRKEADGGLVKSVQSMKKTSVSSSLSSSGEANGHNVSSSRHSSKNASDDDPRMVDRQANRTLPGLIAEIMSEGKRMTYEELCNAVLPHWPHLRKHNGERYAYSSHSQAVLDCLRNRSEWARLVDRGPKTNSSKKRRKTDADSTSAESEDNGYQRVKNAKDGGSKSLDAHQEDFPKGKRKARKRRRLALQGRGIVRRKRRTSVVSDDESESFSNSCEDDSMPSEDEEMRTSLVGTEASGSSDDGGVR